MFLALPGIGIKRSTNLPVEQNCLESQVTEPTIAASECALKPKRSTIFWEMKLPSTFREEITQMVSGSPVTLDKSFMFRFVFFKDGISVCSIFPDVSDRRCETYLLTNSVEAI